ncbi:MAG TPA: LLM class flavin-dependent oxidoreductase [Candidatus Binataceae bacterium]|nr:LLM class flavin-dependent oxidoreductase [Candidatus Binataceae bacterium]
MEFGLQIANMEPRKFRDVAQSAEGLGFDVLFFPDHIVNEGPERQVDPRALSFDHLAMAALVAEATSKIRIGHLVLCNLFRHPAITAQSLMTLDHISGGRLIAGLGSGWTETEFQMTGIPFPPIAERLRMLDEALTIIKSLWTNERTTFDGEFYKLRDAILWPKPLQERVPIILGGGGRGLLRIAAKHADILNVISPAGKLGKISLGNVKRMNDEVFSEAIRFTHDEARKYGRRPDSIRISNALFVVNITESREATRKTVEMMAPMFGLTPEAAAHMPMALIGTPEECVVELNRRAKAWGVSQFIFSGGVGGDEPQLRLIKEQIAAYVK